MFDPPVMSTRWGRYFTGCSPVVKAGAIIPKSTGMKFPS
jgi:hypothetical protein